VRDYAIAKQVKAQLEIECGLASQALRAIPGIGSGPMGLTPDAVKATPEYREAKARSDATFAALRNFNGKFVKLFAAEIKAERRAKFNPEKE
jgi:hypothetical protein